MINQLINPFRQAGLPALVGAALTAFAVGAVSGYWLTKRYDDAKFAVWQAQLAQSKAVAAEQARQREQAWARRAEQLSAALLDEQQAHATSAQQLKKEIDRVTSQFRAKPGAPLQPAPRCVFTNGFVSVYNRAIGADGLPANQPAGAVDATPDAADAVDSGVSQQDVLAHIVDNGQHQRDIASQLNRLIDYVEGLK